MMLRTIFLGAAAALGIATAVSAAVIPSPVGKTDSLVGKLQERYGYKKDEAEKHVDDYIAGL